MATSVQRTPHWIRNEIKRIEVRVEQLKGELRETEQVMAELRLEESLAAANDQPSEPSVTGSKGID